jgi:hypothetical protein
MKRKDAINERDRASRQRVGCWHVDGWIEERACRLRIEGPTVPAHLFGSKSVLGGEPADPKDFFVFNTYGHLKAFDDARETAQQLMRDIPQVTLICASPIH